MISNHFVETSGLTNVKEFKEVIKFPTNLKEEFQKLKLNEVDLVSLNPLRRETILYVTESHQTATDSSCVLYVDSDGETKVGVLINIFKPSMYPCVPTKCTCKVYVSIQELNQTTSFPTLVPGIEVPINIHGYNKIDEYCVVYDYQLKDVCVKRWQPFHCKEMQWNRN